MDRYAYKSDSYLTLMIVIGIIKNPTAARAVAPVNKFI